MRALLSLASILFALSLLAVFAARVLDGIDPSAVRPVGAKSDDEVEAPATVTVPGRFYRWRDATGRIHYDSSPPPAPIAAEAIPFLRELPIGEPSAPGGSRAARLVERVGPLSVYTADGIAELIEDVERTAELLGARDQQLEAMREELGGGRR